MKRLSLINLHQTGDKAILYDYRTKRYYRHYESQTAVSDYKWIITQPLIIYALETINGHTLTYQGQMRLYYGLFTFVVCAAICSFLMEVCLSREGTKVITESGRIHKPPRSDLTQWAKDCQRRIRNVYLIVAPLVLATGGLVYLFWVVGAPILLTFALCTYDIAYLIWVSARPDLLRKYFKRFATSC